MGNSYCNEEKQRKLGDIVMAVNDYSFLDCSCGLKLKASADYKGEEVSCPKCVNRLELTNDNYSFS